MNSLIPDVDKKVTLFVGVKTTLRALFKACIPYHPILLFDVFKSGEFVFLGKPQFKADIIRLDALFRKQMTSPEYVALFNTGTMTDILMIIEYFKGIQTVLKEKDLDSPIVIFHRTLLEYKTVEYHTAEDVTSEYFTTAANTAEIQKNLVLMAQKMDLTDYTVGVFMKTTLSKISS